MLASWSFLTLIWLLEILPLATAHIIHVAASKKDCFFEDLNINDKMTVTYQVGGGGQLDIDFWLTDPNGRALAKDIKKSQGSTSITAKIDGRHEYCFSNQMSSVVDKLVSFNVHGVIYVEDEGTVAPIEREIRDFANALKTVKDEQEYIVVREQRHRNTAESTNDRVKWWSIFQAIVLFLAVGWQVYYLKSFFEVKRAF